VLEEKMNFWSSRRWLSKQFRSIQ